MFVIRSVSECKQVKHTNTEYIEKRYSTQMALQKKSDILNNLAALSANSYAT